MSKSPRHRKDEPAALCFCAIGRTRHLSCSEVAQRVRIIASSLAEEAASRSERMEGRARATQRSGERKNASVLAFRGVSKTEECSTLTTRMPTNRRPCLSSTSCSPLHPLALRGGFLRQGGSYDPDPIGNHRRQQILVLNHETLGRDGTSLIRHFVKVATLAAEAK